MNNGPSPVKNRYAGTGLNISQYTTGQANMRMGEKTGPSSAEVSTFEMQFTQISMLSNKFSEITIVNISE